MKSISNKLDMLYEENKELIITPKEAKQLKKEMWSCFRVSGDQLVDANPFTGEIKYKTIREVFEEDWISGQIYWLDRPIIIKGDKGGRS